MGDNCSDYEGPDRRVCVHHSGMDTKLTIFNWLLGLLIAAIVGSTATLSNVLNGVNTGMSEINIKLAELRSEKKHDDALFQRINERLVDLERRDKGRGQ